MRVAPGTTASRLLSAVIAGLAVCAATDLARGQASVRGQVRIRSPGTLTRLAQRSPSQRFLNVASVGAGPAQTARPTGPLSTSIYTTDRTLLPSTIRHPSRNPPPGSINAQRAAGARTIGTRAGTRSSHSPRLPSTSSTTRYASAAASFPFVAAGRRSAAGGASPLVAIDAPRTYQTITQQSGAALAERSAPVTSLAPAQPGLLRDHMLKGEQAFRQGYYAQAIRCFRLATDLSFNSPESVLSMFHAEFAVGGNSYSTEAYLLIRVLRAMPELPLVPLQPSAFYDRPRDYGQQVARLEEYCRRFPDDGEAQLVLAYFKWFDDDVDAAVTALTLADDAAEVADAPRLLEAIDTFWNGMVASGLVAGGGIGPTDQQDEPPPPYESPVSAPQTQGPDEPHEP